MLYRPLEYSGLDPAKFNLMRAPVASIDNMHVPHHYEVFLNHPDFAKPDDELCSGGWVIGRCAYLGQTGWFDELALDMALCELHGESSTPLSVNVSPASACDRRFLSVMDSMLADNSAVLDRLTLELTETANRVPNHCLYDFVYRAQEHGVHVYLDDIGRGRFAVDHIDPMLLDLCDGIKFAGGYVGEAISGCPEGWQQRRAMRRFAEEAYRMGKTITIEGVHHLDCLRWLVKEGIPFDYVQPGKRSTLQDIIKPRADQKMDGGNAVREGQRLG